MRDSQGGGHALQGSPLLRHEEMRHIRLLHREKPQLFLYSSRISGQASVRPDDALAEHSQFHSASASLTGVRSCMHGVPYVGYPVSEKRRMLYWTNMKKL